MKVTRVLASLAVIGGLSVPAVAAASTKTNPHATYALGGTKKCKTSFIKKTERHDVKGKSARYVACVYVAPPKVTVGASIPTTTVAPINAPSPQLPVPPTTTAPTATTTAPALPVPQIEIVGNATVCGMNGCQRVVAVLPVSGYPVPTGTVCVLPEAGYGECFAIAPGPVEVEGIMQVGNADEAVALVPTLSAEDEYTYSGNTIYAAVVLVG